jgi:hypothetical protein
MVCVRRKWKSDLAPVTIRSLSFESLKQELPTMTEQKRWFHKPDMIVAMSAIIISVCALFTSVYEAHLERQQANAEVWPYVQVFQSNQSGFEIIVHNSGIGPALIRDYRVQYRGKTIHGWSELIPSAPEPDNFQTINSYLYGRAVSPETRISVLTMPPGKNAAFFHAGGEFDIKVCYCSVFDQCWIAAKNSPEPQPVKECLVDENTLFKQ